MKAQELRDRLAGVRSFDIYVDGKKAMDTITDITSNIVHVLSVPASSVDLEKLMASTNGTSTTVKKSEVDKLFDTLKQGKGDEKK